MATVAVSRRTTGNARTELTRDTKADPLLLACSTRSVDGHADLLVTLVQVINHLLALLLNLSDSRLLLHDQRVHILEQLGELYHLLLNLDQRIVAILHRAQRGTSTALAIAVHERLLENLAVRAGILHRGTDFLF